MFHLHVSALDAVTTFAYVIIVGFVWRMIAAKLAESPIGKAMSALY